MRLPFNFNIKIFKNPKQEEELGETGTSFWDGFITNEDYVSELTGSSALIIYDKMRKSDGVVKAALLACELPIRAASWYIEPASDEDKNREVADFISECLFNEMTITWDDFLRQALLMLPFGFSCFEKVFTSVDFQKKQMIGWRKFAPRLQKTILKWKTDAGEDGIVQQLPVPVKGKPSQVSIPIEKLLIFTHQKEGDNWTGISVLRSAYRPWFFKNHIEKINAMAFERQGMGIPYGNLPKNYTSRDKSRMEVLLKNIRANEQAYLLKPADWDVGFVDMKSHTLKDPDESIRRYNREILISVLAQFLDLGSGPTGSRALSADHSSVFHNNLTAVAQAIRDIINKYAIKQLVDLNYTVSYYPTLEFSNIGLAHYETIARALTGLIQQGAITPDTKLEDYLRQLMKLPEKPEIEVEEEKPKEVPKQKELKPEEEKKASEFFAWRSLTYAERKIKFDHIQKKMNEAEEKLKSSLKDIMTRISNDLIRQLQIVLEASSNAEKQKRISAMTVHYKKDYGKEILASIKDMFQYGKVSASNEMKKTPPSTPAKLIQDMSKQTDTLTDIMANDMLKAGKLALLLAFQEKKFDSEILRRITKAIKGESDNVLNNVPTITIGRAINEGRRAAFGFYQDDIYALQRSEILDEVTCNYCMSIDRRIFRKNDAFTEVDQIHSHCRGIWVEILKEEEDKPAIEGMPQSLRDSFETINVFKPPRHPIIKKGSETDEIPKEIEGLKKEVDELKKLTNVEL